jgi:hypothetical protein
MSNMASALKMNKGTQRLIASADIKHHIFPLSLFLTREELMNSVRYGAKNIWIRITELDNGTLRFAIEDNGSGKADPVRLSSPAEANGGGTARYGAGLHIARLKRGNLGDSWSAAWKEAGTDEASCMRDDTQVRTLPIPFEKYHPWSKATDHGFIHTSIIQPTKLGSVALSEIAQNLREIVCGSMFPATLASVEIDITVTDKAGKVVSQANSKAEKWVSFEEAVLSAPGTQVWDKKTMMRGNVRTTVTYAEVKLKGRNGCIKDFPNYGAVNAPHAMIGQEGFFVADMPLHEALERPKHGSAMYRKYMFVEFDLVGSTDVTALPTPASTKTSYLSECQTYRDCMKDVRGAQPSKWASWNKTTPEASPAISDASSPDVAPAPAPAKKKPGRPPKAKPAPAPEPAPAPAPAPDAPAPKKTRIVIRKKGASPAPAQAPVPEPEPAPEPAPAPEVDEAVVPVVDPDVEWFHTVVARMRGVLERYPDLRTGLV